MSTVTNNELDAFFDEYVTNPLHHASHPSELLPRDCIITQFPHMM